MDEPDEVDYGDSDSDFADLEVDDEGDGSVQPEATTSQPADGEPCLVGYDKEEGEATPRASPMVAATAASSELEDGEFIMDSEPMVIAATLLKIPRLSSFKQERVFGVLCQERLKTSCLRYYLTLFSIRICTSPQFNTCIGLKLPESSRLYGQT